jgi:hypothetical protein
MLQILLLLISINTFLILEVTNLVSFLCQAKVSVQVKGPL